MVAFISLDTLTANYNSKHNRHACFLEEVQTISHNQDNTYSACISTAELFTNLCAQESKTRGTSPVIRFQESQWEEVKCAFTAVDRENAESLGGSDVH